MPNDRTPTATPSRPRPDRPKTHKARPKSTAKAKVAKTAEAKTTGRWLVIEPIQYMTTEGKVRVAKPTEIDDDKGSVTGTPGARYDVAIDDISDEHALKLFKRGCLVHEVAG